MMSNMAGLGVSCCAVADPTKTSELAQGGTMCRRRRRECNTLGDVCVCVCVCAWKEEGSPAERVQEAFEEHHREIKVSPDLNWIKLLWDKLV